MAVAESQCKNHINCCVFECSHSLRKNVCQSPFKQYSSTGLTINSHIGVEKANTKKNETQRSSFLKYINYYSFQWWIAPLMLTKVILVSMLSLEF